MLTATANDLLWKFIAQSPSKAAIDRVHGLRDELALVPKKEAYQSRDFLRLCISLEQLRQLVWSECSRRLLVEGSDDLGVGEAPMRTQNSLAIFSLSATGPQSDRDTTHGQTALTLTPLSPASMAATLVSPTTACLLAV